MTLTGPQSVIRVGDGSSSGTGYSATIDTEISGTTQVVKTDLGRLILGGANSYTGGTLIRGGTLQIRADASLGNESGKLEFDGGALETSADISSNRDVILTGSGTILTNSNVLLTLNGTISGPGLLSKTGTGTLIVNGGGGNLAAGARVLEGTIAVNGQFAGNVDIALQGRLEGDGFVTAVNNAGVVAPGSGLGSLTIFGDYAGAGGSLEIETVLGGDNSPADILVIGGSTSGITKVKIINHNGLGAQTDNGIKIIDVSGPSNGRFVLDGDYLFHGDPTIIAGAYGYRLYKNGITDPRDGNWYLRSSLLDSSENPELPLPPDSPADPAPAAPPPQQSQPLFQPGVPLYETYAQTLLTLNTLPSLYQRVGGRVWADATTTDNTGVWGRMEGGYRHPKTTSSTSTAERRVGKWQIQMGIDAILAGNDEGDTSLVGGITAHYGHASTKTDSVFGNGKINARSHGIGATLTWYGHDGLYADGQAAFTWFRSDLKSDTLGMLAHRNHGTGTAFSLELGKRSAIDDKIALIP